MLPEPARILIVRLSHLGDVVHALPVYHALRGAFPTARLGWVVQPEFAPLVRGLPGLERTIEFDRRAGARAWLHLRREFRAFDAQLTVDCQGNTKSGAATWLTRAPRRVGLAAQDWREPFAARALTEHAAPVRSRTDRAQVDAARRRGPHALERMLALVEHLAGASAHPARHDAALSEEERTHGVRLAELHLPGPHGDARPVIQQLGDPRDVRSWPLARHMALSRALDEAGVPHLLLSGPGEVQHGDALARELPRTAQRRHWVGQRGLRELAGFFEAAARRGARFLGSDSGPMHLAAACGLPVTLLEGPQSHRRTGPWPLPDAPGSPNAALRSPSSPDCAPCFARRCQHPAGPVCMSELLPARVLESLLST